MFTLIFRELFVMSSDWRVRDLSLRLWIASCTTFSFRSPCSLVGRGALSRHWGGASRGVLRTRI